MVEELYSSDEVAQLLGITLNNLRQKQHRKQLCWHIKTGRQVFYRKEDVDNYLAKRDG